MIEAFGSENAKPSIGLLLAVILFCTTTIGCHHSSKPVIEMPARLTLYSIDGRDGMAANVPAGTEMFHGYPVLGKVEISDAAAIKEIVGALNRGMADHRGEVANCFWPRHGMRAMHRQGPSDYVICFECDQLRIETLRKTIPITISPQKVLNHHLTAAGVPLATGMSSDVP